MKYNVYILKGEPFEKQISFFGRGDSIIRRDDTVKVIFYNEDETIYKTEVFGYVEMNEIRQCIVRGEHLLLDFCYVELDLKDIDFSTYKISSIFAEKTFFNGKADFSQVTFSGDVDFRGAIFSGDADFSNTTLSGDADFEETTFSSDSSFWGATFCGNAKFIEATFIGNANFSYAKFNKMVNFLGATIKSSIFYGNIIFSEHVDMSFEECNELTIFNCVIEKTIGFGDVRFSKLSFSNTKNLGQIFMDWKLNNIKESIKASDNSYFRIAKQFLFLKENFNKIGHYDDEDEAYVQYRRNENLSELFYNKKIFKSLFKLIVFDFIGLYATRPLRILLALFLNIVLFSIIYDYFGVASGKFENGNNSKYYSAVYNATHVFLGQGAVEKVNHFCAALYYSAITAFTVGYGDVSPGRILVALLACLESFIGLFLMSYFTVAFSRKVLR